MNDPPSLPPIPYGHLAPRGRPPRAASSSPIRQRNTDDILSSLTPRSVVDAFRNPTGSLKECMDAATPAEQAFAVRAAVASKNIQEWLEEVSSWIWPSGGGSAGFEAPPSQSYEQPVGEESSPSDRLYWGSLPATEVTQYEVRIDQIWRDMHELDVEEIKDQILHNHIRPLSRPGTPMLDSSRSVTSSLSTFARMDDLTTLITATMINALPNLARLTRLLNIWSIRVRVLKKIPAFLTSATDGELALQSGWSAISLPGGNGHEGDAAGDGSAVLSRKAFEVMKSILERKVVRAGQNLDSMLNVLVSSEETLPDEWVDRVDSLEREYGEWVVVCERMIREADLAGNSLEALPTSVQDTGPKEANRSISPDKEPHVSAEPANSDYLATKTATTGDIDTVSATKTWDEFTKRSRAVMGKTLQRDDLKHKTDATVVNTTPAIEVHVPTEEVEELSDGEPQLAPSHSMTEDEPIQPTKHISNMGQDHTPSTMDGSSPDEAYRYGKPPQNPGRGVAPSPALLEALPIDSDYESDKTLSDIIDSDFEFGEPSGRDSPQELPTLPRPRRDSDISTPSTVVHGDQSGFEFSSDPPDHGTPEMSRFRGSDLTGAAMSTDVSPASTASAFRSSIRSQSASFNDMPTVEELPDNESSPKTPLKSSFLADSLPRDSPSPGRAGANHADDQLQQQISEILESVPAKIRLTSEPSAINLNPPDFVMPTTRRASKPDPIPRSQSSLSTVSNRSSRAGTPSFTLAPAFNRNSRSRPQRGNNQDIKLYHLSRSNGEAPIKLFIRCVGENGERVMVRVGGGWADLGEYLKEYASHHGRRSATGGETSKVEVKDFSRVLASRATSTPPSRPASVQESYSSPSTSPLHVRKTRKPASAASGPKPEDSISGLEKQLQPNTPLSTSTIPPADTQSSGGSTTRSRSRSSSHLSWDEEDSSLGMAGPRAKHVEMSEESKAWVESVKAKVRIASGDSRKVSESTGLAGGSGSVSGAGAASAASALVDKGKFGDMGKVGATKRLFRKQG